MRARALTAAGGSGERLRVVTSAGTMDGLWRGDVPVAVDDVLQIELEVRLPRDWSDIERVQDQHSTIHLPQSRAFLEGIVLDIDQDGVLSLDVAGAPLMVETTGEPPLGIVGGRVRLRLVAGDLEFHPMGV